MISILFPSLALALSPCCSLTCGGSLRAELETLVWLRERWLLADPCRDLPISFDICLFTFGSNQLQTSVGGGDLYREPRRTICPFVRLTIVLNAVQPTCCNVRGQTQVTTEVINLAELTEFKSHPTSIS